VGLRLNFAPGPSIIWFNSCMYWRCYKVYL